MTPSGQLSAAIEVLAEIETRHRPAHDALAEWGRARRFAGSGDRSAIGNLVFDALRRRASIGWAMGEDTPRALALGTLGFAWGEPVEAIQRRMVGPHAPEPLTERERCALTEAAVGDAPDWVRGDYPEWLAPHFAEAFGDEAAAEGVALAERAPIDLRVNTLKATREKVLKALQRFGPRPTALSPAGIRITQRAGPAKSSNVEAEAAHAKGWFEVQDEGSQLAAFLAGAGPKSQVLDLCAGAGGKTLALAAAMQNTGQAYAYDADRLRLRPIFDRLKRAGARNVQVLRGGDTDALDAMRGKFDLVLVDAPCTGSGVWRRRPDAKWRLKPAMLETRVAEQASLLDLAATLVRPGGRVAYVTCSVLPVENARQVDAFIARDPRFAVAAFEPAWRAMTETDPPVSAINPRDLLQLTPKRHATDGFFISLLQQSGL